MKQIYTPKSFDVEVNEPNLESKLKLIADVKNFSVQKLGLALTNNYLRYRVTNPRTFYQLYVAPKVPKNLEDILFAEDTGIKEYNQPVVLRSETDDLKLHQKYYKKKGYDVRRRKIQNFYDNKGCDLTPGFLNRTSQSQVRTVLHEDWHHTFQSWNEGQQIDRNINESAAQIVSYIGAAEFFYHTEGADSSQYRRAVRNFKSWMATAEMINETYEKLQEIYDSDLDDRKKLNRRRMLFLRLRAKGWKIDNASIREDYAYTKHAWLLYKAYLKAGTVQGLVNKMEQCPAEEQAAVDYLMSYIQM